MGSLWRPYFFLGGRVDVRKINFLLKAKIVERFGTQADFSEAIGRNLIYVFLIVRGRKPLDAVGRKKWARVLGCDGAIFDPPGTGDSTPFLPGKGEGF